MAAVGEVFGPYHLERLLGRGGMGEVYRAFDTTRKRVVALKVLTPQLAADPAYQARFRAESELAARLRSAHVIPIHDYGEIDGVLYLDMRLVDGEDLSDRLHDRGPLSPADAVQVINQTASALDAAHAAGLVHRDVKPSNILLSTAEGDGPGFAYLVDFGIARTIDGTGGLTGTGGVVGSVDYMAPERFEGHPIDRRADVYALACTLFEALTGSKPFPSATLAVTLYSHLHTPPPRPSERRPGISPAFDQVVARGMAKDPRHRFGTAGELAAAARAALTAPVPPAHLPPQQRPQQPGRGYATTHPGQRPPPGYGQTRTGPPPTPPPPTRTPQTMRNRVLAVVGAVVLVAGGVWAVVASSGGGTPADASGPGTSVADPGAPRVVRVVENLPVRTSSGVAIDPAGATYYLSGQSDSPDDTDSYQLKSYALDGNEPGPALTLGTDYISAMELSPDGTRLYAIVSVDTLEPTSTYQLTATDPATGTVLTTTPLAGPPSSFVVAPGGDLLYLGSPSGVEIIDPVAGRSVGSIAVGGTVDDMTFTPDGRLLTVGTSGVKVVDPAARAVVSSVNLRGGPSGIAVTPDGRQAVICTQSNDAVAFMDLESLVVTGGVPVGSRPMDVIVTPDGQQALVANERGSSISVIDLGTTEVTSLNVGNGPKAMALSPDGLTGLVVTSSNVVRIERVTT